MFFSFFRINIGDFDVKRIIGRGNFADVKLAREKSSGNVYALKVMRKGGENVSAFYEEERDIMARATSPWLTKLDYAFQVGCSVLNTCLSGMRVRRESKYIEYWIWILNLD